MRETEISSIFSFETDKADYNLSGNDNTMMLKVIKGRTGPALSMRSEDKNLILTPIREMSEKEINFFCKQLNFYWTEHQTLPEVIMVFDDKNLYEYDKQFIWVDSPKFKPQTKAKIKKVLIVFGKIVGVLCLVSILLLYIMEEHENQTLNSIANNIYEWLLGKS